MGKCNAACQTSIKSVFIENKRFTWREVVVVAFIIYLLLCSGMLYSSYLQSCIIYLNHARFPLGNLLDLQRFGLHNSRNIKILTGKYFMYYYLPLL